MRKMGKWMFIVTLTICMLLPSMVTNSKATASSDGNTSDLIILQNVPQADAAIKGDSFELSALNVYEDGYFKKVDEGLEWSSKNRKVATVDKEGTVTFSGKPGRSWITVTNGDYKDRIAVHVEPDHPKKEDAVNKKVIKEKGDRYDLVAHALENMTMEEKVGQMLMPDFRKWDGENVTKMLPEIEEQVKKYHLGGVILFRENVVTTEQTAELVSDYQAAAEKYGLLMTIDQEGGIVTRLQSGTDFPGNMALGATRSEEITQNVGQAIGEELSSLGINMNLAPVMDVNNNPDNPVIGVRSFGGNPELVAQMGVAYTKGLQETGVAATAKHFPGHGDTAVDSHLGLPEVPHDKERLKEVELYPFQKAMDAGIDAVMTAHVTFPKIDDTKVISKKDGTEIALPATLSEKVLTGLMREEMGYEGVVITDALNMNAIQDHFGPVDAVIRSINAGTDIVLMPVGLEKVANGIYDAIDSGDIPMDTINDSVKRILTLKLNRGIIKSENPTTLDEKIAKAEQVVGSEAHKQVEEKAAEQSITLVKNDNVLPLELDKDEEVVVVGNSFSEELAEQVKKHHENTTLIKSSSGAFTDEQKELVENADQVIVGTYTYNVSTRAAEHPQMQLMHEVMNTRDGDVIGVGIRNPYDIMAYPEVDAFIAQYGFRAASFEATAETIFGENDPSGELPVAIPDQDGGTLFPYGTGLSYGDRNDENENDDEEEQDKSFQLGVEELLDEEKALIEGKKVGLITNPTGVDQELNSIVDILYNDEDVDLTALYGPEHGVRGSAQAGEYVDFYTDEQTGLPVYSLYGKTRKPTPEMLEDIDVLMFDIQDVGTRFYTYIYTMAYAMEAAQENDIPFIVLDRPNPIGGDKVEGPVLDTDYKSFVGNYPIPLRHGMTVGELAKLFNSEYDIDADLTVVEMDGYDRSMDYNDTDMSFVAPSPNMPTVDTAYVYPGAALIEGTNVSEGRGTTRPFELIGAPFINSTELAAAMNKLDLPGVRFRAASFTPAFSKHAGELTHGVQLHVMDRDKFNPVATGVNLVKTIHDMYPDDFQFREENSSGISFFDYLIGNGWVREGIEEGRSVSSMQNEWEKDLKGFKKIREQHLLYK
ncbi:beta-N-acetylhexosaminidase [Halobacillus alkaliphilus]|uniref:Beta-N-acetylhexosaminidase n=1 Tax=Halobacillus alkaliphilus TaxID=396056 RepID=A0A1I2PPQ0_9BACI|nr:beta-N-acetylhexosaminidase [Halobacillus alkaliphilus]